MDSDNFGSIPRFSELRSLLVFLENMSLHHYGQSVSTDKNRSVAFLGAGSIPPLAEPRDAVGVSWLAFNLSKCYKTKRPTFRSGVSF